MDFIDKYRERVGTLRGFLETANFKGCANLSTDLLRTSEFANYSEGIFIGEFFESLFSNVRNLVSRFDVEKNDIEKIQKATFPIIEYVQTNIPFSEENKKAKFYDLILNARCIVTENQIAYYRGKTIKKLASPMPFSPSIEIESEEE